MKYFRNAKITIKSITIIIASAIFISSLSVYLLDFRQNIYADIVYLPLEQILNKPFIPAIGKEEHFPLMRGIEINPSSTQTLTFYFDKMGKHKIQQRDLNRFIKYFLGFLTIPKTEVWVNLAPHEKDKMLSDALANVDIGKDLLLEDYLLKQLTASLTNPKTKEGKKFWQKVYQKAEEICGTKNVVINTNYKVWIVPDAADVYEYTSARESKIENRESKPQNTKMIAFVKDAKLKVMMETDYHNNVKQPGKGLISPVPNRHKLRTQGATSAKIQNPAPYNFEFSGVPPDNRNKKVREINAEAKEIFKKELLPIIEREVNQSVIFAPLRQMFHCLILADYAKNVLSSNPLFARYINQEKTKGINISNPQQIKNKIFAAYLDALNQGSYQVVNEKNNRKYFSGGVNAKAMKVNYRKGDLSETTHDPNLVATQVGFNSFNLKGFKKISLSQQDVHLYLLGKAAKEKKIEQAINHQYVQRTLTDKYAHRKIVILEKEEAMAMSSEMRELIGDFVNPFNAMLVPSGFVKVLNQEHKDFSVTSQDVLVVYQRAVLGSSLEKDLAIYLNHELWHPYVRSKFPNIDRQIVKLILHAQTFYMNNPQEVMRAFVLSFFQTLSDMFLNNCQIQEGQEQENNRIYIEMAIEDIKLKLRNFSLLFQRLPPQNLFLAIPDLINFRALTVGVLDLNHVVLERQSDLEGMYSMLQSGLQSVFPGKDKLLNSYITRLQNIAVKLYGEILPQRGMEDDVLTLLMNSGNAVGEVFRHALSSFSNPRPPTSTTFNSFNVGDFVKQVRDSFVKFLKENKWTSIVYCIDNQPDVAQEFVNKLEEALFGRLGSDPLIIEGAMNALLRVAELELGKNSSLDQAITCAQMYAPETALRNQENSVAGMVGLISLAPGTGLFERVRGLALGGSGVERIVQERAQAVINQIAQMSEGANPAMNIVIRQAQGGAVSQNNVSINLQPEAAVAENEPEVRDLNDASDIEVEQVTTGRRQQYRWQKTFANDVSVSCFGQKELTQLIGKAFEEGDFLSITLPQMRNRRILVVESQECDLLIPGNRQGQGPANFIFSTLDFPQSFTDTLYRYYGVRLRANDSFPFNNDIVVLYEPARIERSLETLDFQSNHEIWHRVLRSASEFASTDVLIGMLNLYARTIWQTNQTQLNAMVVGFYDLMADMFLNRCQIVRNYPQMAIKELISKITYQSRIPTGTRQSPENRIAWAFNYVMIMACEIGVLDVEGVSLTSAQRALLHQRFTDSFSQYMSPDALRLSQQTWIPELQRLAKNLYDVLGPQLNAWPVQQVETNCQKEYVRIFNFLQNIYVRLCRLENIPYQPQPISFQGIRFNSFGMGNFFKQKLESGQTGDVLSAVCSAPDNFPALAALARGEEGITQAGEASAEMIIGQIAVWVKGKDSNLNQAIDSAKKFLQGKEKQISKSKNGGWIKDGKTFRVADLNTEIVRLDSFRGQNQENIKSVIMDNHVQRVLHKIKGKRIFMLDNQTAKRISFVKNILDNNLSFANKVGGLQLRLDREWAGIINREMGVLAQAGDFVLVYMSSGWTQQDLEDLSVVVAHELMHAYLLTDHNHIEQMEQNNLEAAIKNLEQAQRLGDTKKIEAAQFVVNLCLALSDLFLYRMEIRESNSDITLRNYRFIFRDVVRNINEVNAKNIFFRIQVRPPKIPEMYTPRMKYFMERVCFQAHAFETRLSNSRDFLDSINALERDHEEKYTYILGAEDISNCNAWVDFLQNRLSQTIYPNSVSQIEQIVENVLYGRLPSSFSYNSLNFKGIGTALYKFSAVTKNLVVPGGVNLFFEAEKSYPVPLSSGGSRQPNYLEGVTFEIEKIFSQDVRKL